MKLISLFILFFALSCAPSLKTYSLDRIPEYNFDAYAKEYRVVLEAQQEFESLVMGLAVLPYSGIQLTPPQIRAINLELDKFIFWKAAADIQGFHGEYELMRKSVATALLSLEEIVKLVQEIIKTQGTAI